MSCSTCPAAFVIEGASPSHRAVLCRANSTTRGQRDEDAGPIDIVREDGSAAALHGFCLGDLPDYVEEVLALGPLANDDQRDLAKAAHRTGANPSYVQCTTWIAERYNRMAQKLADQPGRRGTLKAPHAA